MLSSLIQEGPRGFLCTRTTHSAQQSSPAFFHAHGLRGEKFLSQIRLAYLENSPSMAAD